jgi:hypothetical protein
MSRVVFLDVDGVLNSATWFDQRGPRPPGRPHFDHNIDPVAIRHLNRLTGATGAALVITSTWRKGCSLRQLRADFTRTGCWGHVISKTLDLSPAARGVEIAAWLKTHRWVTTFVILDDDADMGALSAHLVQTSHETGLTEADVDRAIALLMQEAGSV